MSKYIPQCTSMRFCQQASQDVVNTTRTFGMAATSYDQNASVQNKVACDLASFWKARIKQAPQSICELGCGTGVMTRHIREAMPEAHLLATDGSQRMLEIAATRLPPAPQLRFASLIIQPSLELPHTCDWVIANMTFQWVANLTAVLNSLRQQCHAILFSTVLAGSFQPWLDAHRKIGLRAGLRPFLTLKELQACCERAGGISCIEEREYRAHFTDPLDFARNLKATGASSPRRGHEPVNLRRVCQEFPNGIEINYRVALADIQI